MTAEAYPLQSRERSSWCNYEISDVARHHAYLREALADDWDGDNFDLKGDVALLPELGNDPSRWAIAVQFRGITVGHLRSDECAEWSETIGRIVQAGWTPTTEGHISGWASNRWATDPGPDGRPQRFFNVALRIRLGDPRDAIPLNNPPNVRHTLLRRAQTPVVKVTRTEQHTDTLLPYVPEHGAGPLIATLHEISVTTGKATRPAIEVRIDNKRVGQLTPQTGQRFLEMVRHHDGQGLTTACWVNIKGSSVAAELTLDAIKAHEATPRDLDGTASKVLPPLQTGTRASDIRDFPTALVVRAPALSPNPLPAATPLVEPLSEGSVVSVRVGRSYTYLGIRVGNDWHTTATEYSEQVWTPESTAIREIESWDSLCSKGDRVQIATRWQNVSVNDPRFGHHRTVMRFSLRGKTVAMLTINGYVDYDQPRWYYTLGSRYQDELSNEFYDLMDRPEELWRQGANHQIAVCWKYAIASASLAGPIR